MVPAWSSASARRSLLSAVAAAAVLSCVVLLQRSKSTELMHIGALTAAMEARDGGYVEGGGEREKVAARRGMFTEHTASTPRTGGAVIPKTLIPKVVPASSGDGFSPKERAARRREDQHAVTEIHAAEQAATTLAQRDAKLEDTADKNAAQLLDAYSDAVNGAVDGYEKLSQQVDERSARAFEGLPARAPSQTSEPTGPQTTARRAGSYVPAPVTAGAGAGYAVEPGDPLASQKQVFNRLGASGSLYRVPAEYQGMTDVTGGSSSVRIHLPKYVQRAQHEVADAWYMREKAVPQSLLEVPHNTKKHLDRVEREAKAPLRRAKGKSVKQIIHAAVQSALAQHSPELSSFMTAESQDRAEAKAHPLGLSENAQEASLTASLLPAKGTSKLTQLLPQHAREQQQARGRQEVFGNEVRGHVEPSVMADDSTEDLAGASSADTDLASQQLPGTVRHSQTSMFHSTWQHLNNQIDSIFGPSRAELRLRAARRAAVKARKRRLEERVRRVQQMARAINGKGRGRAATMAAAARVAAAKRQQLLAARDAAMQAKERKEVDELRDEVKKLRERAKVRKLKAQVGVLRQQVLEKQEDAVKEEEKEDQAHVDVESIKDAFDRVDVDTDNTITVDQVKAALRDLDLDISESMLQEVLTAEGIEDKDPVDLEGFTDIVNRVQEKLKDFGERPRVCEDKLRDIFDHFDESHDGKISKEELSEGLAELGVDLSEEEIDEMLAQIKRQEARDKEADDKEGGVYTKPDTGDEEERKDGDEEGGTSEDGEKKEDEGGEDGGDKEEGKEGEEEEEDGISFEEFKNFALREAFDLYDSNGSGYISTEELRSAAEDLGVDISLQRAEALEKRFDRDGDGRMNFKEFKEAWLEFCTVHSKPETKRMWVCDAFSCGWQTLAPPKTWHALTAEEGKEDALDKNGKDIFDMIFPWEHTWDSEVSLNDKGEIRAHHDDPHSHLMPHNKFQNAEYPDGEMHVRTTGQKRPGITNQVATHLFADNIVTAAPGFNAGTGRHVRAQQGIDWERNWAGSKESVRGRDEKGKPLVVK